MTGIRVIKGFRRSDHRIARFRDQVRRAREAELHKARLLGGIAVLITVLPGLAMAGALLTGAVQAAHGNLSTGTLLAFAGAVAALRPAIEQTGVLLAVCHEVGDRGGRFSSGERQLIALARVLLVNPSVIVLDEATAVIGIPGGVVGSGRGGGLAWLGAGGHPAQQAEGALADDGAVGAVVVNSAREAVWACYFDDGTWAPEEITMSEDLQTVPAPGSREHGDRLHKWDRLTTSNL